MFIRCSKCGKKVSTEVPENTVIRAWIECPECVESEKDTEKDRLVDEDD